MVEKTVFKITMIRKEFMKKKTMKKKKTKDEKKSVQGKSSFSRNLTFDYINRISSKSYG